MQHDPRILFAAACLALTAIAQEPAPATRTAATATRPNFVFLLAEGTGAVVGGHQPLAPVRLPTIHACTVVAAP